MRKRLKVWRWPQVCLIAGLYFLVAETTALSAHHFLSASQPEYLVGGLFFATSAWIAFLVRDHSQTKETLQQWEERNQAIFDASLGASVEMDPAGRITLWDSGAETLFGWPAAEAVGRKLSETIIPVRDRERHERGLRHFLTTGEGVRLNHCIESTALHREGREFPVELTVIPIRRKDGTSFTAFLRDISERKQAGENIERLNAELRDRAAGLEDANRELEAFNYAVAHDLRKPLTAVSGYCQLLQELCSTGLDEACREYLQEAHKGACQMNQLIDRLLDLSQLSRSETVRETIDLSALAQTVADELRLTDPGRRVDFRVPGGITATGDEILLRVVMGNLLGNAWKFTAMREETLIEFGVTASGDEKVYFVRDNGIGFDMSEVNKLFLPFQRLPGTQEFKGHGIGLATVERIIRRHGGRIWAEGKLGEGATFYFTLPE